MTLVSTNWLNENLNKVKIIDASWHLVKNRNAIEEYNKEHIENAIFFDLDKNSNKKKIYHMVIFFHQKVSTKKIFQNWEYQILIKLLFTVIVI